LTPALLSQIPAAVLRGAVPGATLADALPRLRETYCGTIAYEIEHLAPHDERVWLRRVIESGEHRRALQPEDRRRLLESLVKVEGLESFLHRAYLGHKRFGIEGLDALVPILTQAIELVAEDGTQQVVMGMAHRGRLNVLTHVIGVPYETLLAEFEGGREVEETLAPRGGTGDVKYHHGAEGVFRTKSGGEVTVTLMPNPSHLEAVNPVVEGFARAVQTDRTVGAGVHHPERCFPILIHGDAAFAGQGVVAETFNLANVHGYDTGGTLHIITNNQIGFTTPPHESRSTDFASDLAKGFDVPIIHVNADDIEACIAAVNLAMMYRARYRKDCVIDLVGYRRHGHNEGDEPRYTQPTMYRAIDTHPTVRQLYAESLQSQGVLTLDWVEGEMEAHNNGLLQIQRKLQDDVGDEDLGEEPVRTGMFEAFGEPETAVDEASLHSMNEHLLQVPNEFHINPKLARQLERRRVALDGDARIDWALAEVLAYGSLLGEGVPVRLTGQDTERGTFSQRHMVLHDGDTGERYSPVQNLPNARASLELYNSPLSEYAALGFEYGYSVHSPDALVLWEAQFGDFVNGAEIIVDQFITAGLAKWGQTSRLVLLLPHGYEGQGPEHSSARVERFLALAAEDNIRVANCSTPAQYYHILRWQAKHPQRRPLVMMTPKSLLRLPQAASRVTELATGGFQQVLDDATLQDAPVNVSRLLLCSGKVYYDITMSARRPEAKHVAVGRIEMLYPFPQQATRDLIQRYPDLREIVWVQEEPSNFGARKWMVPQIGTLVDGIPVRYVSRPERSSPAEGYPAAHRQEQDRIIAEALA
jgi:2-oxoglutarate dehydrogenase E1 component